MQQSLDYPEGLVKLSKHYKIVIPRGVADEITKSPGKERLEARVHVPYLFKREAGRKY